METKHHQEIKSTPTLGSLLGSGSYCKVYADPHQSSSVIRVYEDAEELAKEVYILEWIHHVLDKHKIPMTERPLPERIQEWNPGQSWLKQKRYQTDLYDWIVRVYDRTNETHQEQLCWIFFRVIVAVWFASMSGVLHMDIKASNVLLTSSPSSSPSSSSSQMDVIVNDWNLITMLKEYTNQGTYPWMQRFMTCWHRPPELNIPRASSSSVQRDPSLFFSSVVWSLGSMFAVCMYYQDYYRVLPKRDDPEEIQHWNDTYMLSGKRCDGNDPNSVRRCWSPPPHLSGSKWSSSFVYSQMNQLIQSCLVEHPADRCSLQDMVFHPCFKSYRSKWNGTWPFHLPTPNFSTQDLIRWIPKQWKELRLPKEHEWSWADRVQEYVSAGWNSIHRGDAWMFYQQLKETSKNRSFAYTITCFHYSETWFISHKYDTSVGRQEITQRGILSSQLAPPLVDYVGQFSNLDSMEQWTLSKKWLQAEVQLLTQSWFALTAPTSAGTVPFERIMELQKWMDAWNVDTEVMDLVLLLYRKLAIVQKVLPVPGTDEEWRRCLASLMIWCVFRMDWCWFSSEEQPESSFSSSFDSIWTELEGVTPRKWKEWYMDWIQPIKRSARPVSMMWLLDHLGRLHGVERNLRNQVIHAWLRVRPYMFSMPLSWMNGIHPYDIGHSFYAAVLDSRDWIPCDVHLDQKRGPDSRVLDCLRSVIRTLTL